MLELRDYQEKAIAETIGSLRQEKKTILVAPTGSGKTVMATELVKRVKRRTLWLAHRRELIAQGAATLHNFGLDVGVIQAGQTARRHAPVQVASVQTLVNREAPPSDLIVIDEAHHARASTYHKILDRYPGAAVVGLTATPFRLDGKSLGDIFDALVVAAYPDELCDRGTLVEPTVYAPPAPDMKGVRVQAGEYNMKQAAAKLDRPTLIADIVETWKKRTNAQTSRTVVFAINVQHSKHIVERFCEAGIQAEHLDGSLPAMQRMQILARLRSGETTVVSNCMVLTEGWDLPALQVAVIARPTASLCLHLQMLGRIMRSAPEKVGALVLDHAGNHAKHGLVTSRLVYSLDRPVLRQKEVDGEETDPLDAVKRCPECFLLVPRAVTVCPMCSHIFAAESSVIKEAEGELVEYGRKVSLAVKQAAWDQIEAQRLAFGFKAGWSMYRYKERFGDFPTTVSVNGTRQLIDPKKADKEIKRKVYLDLEATRRAKGFKKGWEAHRYRDIFGVWPRGVQS